MLDALPTPFFASGSYSSEPRWVSQGVTEPAQGFQMPLMADRSIACVSVALSLPVSPSCDSVVRYIAPGWRSNCERSEEHTSELQSLMRTSYDVFCVNYTKKTQDT